MERSVTEGPVVVPHHEVLEVEAKVSGIDACGIDACGMDACGMDACGIDAYRIVVEHLEEAAKERVDALLGLNECVVSPHTFVNVSA